MSEELPSTGRGGSGSSFDYRTVSQQVRFGTGEAAANLATVLDELDARRIMVIVAEPEAELADRITAGLPVVARHDEVVMHVPIDVAQRARAAAAEHAPDVLLSVGGGSTTGLAKAVALTTGLPIVAVPTTYAGSEATNVWGLTERAGKTTGVDDRVLPVAIVYDASLTTSLPIELSVASGLNALAHCIDSMWSPRSNPISRTLAAEGIAALATGLPRVVDDPAGLEGRELLLYAAYVSAVAFTAAGSGLHHKICHVLGGKYDLPHAQTHAVVLPYVLAFNGPAAPDAHGRIAAAFGTPDPLDGLQRLRARIGAPAALADYGFSRNDIDDAAEAILPFVPPDNPRPVTTADLRILLEAAHSGSDPAALSERLGSPLGRPRPTTDTPPDAQQQREQAVVDQVIASFQATDDPRLKLLLQSVTRHLHEFLREVRLTEAEWSAAIAFLTEVGHITDDRRQEFILLSDVLGASMQTIAINNPADADATESTVFGPFFVAGSPEVPLGGDIGGGAPGEPCWVEGTVRDTASRPIPGALIEVWEADADGCYDVQYEEDRLFARGHMFSDEEGAYRFWALTPTPYPIPHDGPVGRMLAAVGRSPMRASHLHFMVTAPGYRKLITHIFVQGDEHLADDTVFGVKESLIKEFVPHAGRTPTPDGRDVGDQSWSSVRFDVVLATA